MGFNYTDKDDSTWATGLPSDTKLLPKSINNQPVYIFRN